MGNSKGNSVLELSGWPSSAQHSFPKNFLLPDHEGLWFSFLTARWTLTGAACPSCCLLVDGNEICFSGATSFLELGFALLKHCPALAGNAHWRPPPGRPWLCVVQC